MAAKLASIEVRREHPGDESAIRAVHAGAFGRQEDPEMTPPEVRLVDMRRHDHVIKHRGWKVRQLRPGIYQLTSPLGHTYTTGPDPP